MTDPKFVYCTGEPPYRQHELDAGFDLCAAEDLELRPGFRCFMPTKTTGIAIPPGHVGMVCSRSGIAMTHGVFVLNAPGIIDAGYRGPVVVILQNSGPQVFKIEPGKRIAQLLIMPLTQVMLVHTDKLPPPLDSRDTDGFGSTGV